MITAQEDQHNDLGKGSLHLDLGMAWISELKEMLCQGTRNHFN